MTPANATPWIISPKRVPRADLSVANAVTWALAAHHIAATGAAAYRVSWLSITVHAAALRYFPSQHAERKYYTSPDADHLGEWSKFPMLHVAVAPDQFDTAVIPLGDESLAAYTVVVLDLQWSNERNLAYFRVEDFPLELPLDENATTTEVDAGAKTRRRPLWMSALSLFRRRF